MKYLCSRCQGLFEKENIDVVNVANEAFFYWCKNCITKHLNTSEVNK